jgi:hypothetical protein
MQYIFAMLNSSKFEKPLGTILPLLNIRGYNTSKLYTLIQQLRCEEFLRTYKMDMEYITYIEIMLHPFPRFHGMLTNGRINK